MSLRSEQGSDAAWTTSVSVKPNSFYRLSGWIRTEGVRGAVGALLNIQNWQHVRTPPVTGTKSWPRVATVFRNGEETLLEVNCLFGGWGESTGQAWYDDVAMEWLADASDPRQAMVTIESVAPKVPHSPMLRGGFIEHFHRQIYGGLFEPGSRLSDEMGFRRDVIEALKDLRLSIVRSPGGCFASGYHWKDGVGKNRKPTYDKGLMSCPTLLMLDEPSLGLSPILVKSIFDIIREINRQGTTILLVAQNVFHSLTLSHRGYVIENGAITISGTGQDLLKNQHIRQSYLGL